MQGVSFCYNPHFQPFISASPHVCTYVCVHVKVRGQCQMSTLIVLHLIIFIIIIFFCHSVFHWTWSSLILLGWLASNSRGSSCLCVPSTGGRCTLPRRLFMRVLGLTDRMSSCLCASVCHTESSPRCPCFSTPPSLALSLWDSFNDFRDWAYNKNDTGS